MKTAALVLTMLLGLGSPALAQSRPGPVRITGHPKISRDLQSASPDDTVNIIVQFKQPVTERHHRIVTERGGSLRMPLPSIKAGLYSVPAARLAEIADDPEVDYLSPDRKVQATLDLANISTNASIEFQSGITGDGVTIAEIDSGILDLHPDLRDQYFQSRVVYSENFNSNAGDSDNVFDWYGHGTHVAGILGGNATMSSGFPYTRAFRGIAPKAKLVNLRVLDGQGTGTDSMVLAAIQRAIALEQTYHIRVINLSLGRPIYESYTKDPLCQAVEAAWKAGMVVVVAAGNLGRNTSGGTNGYGTITAPGNDPYVITVGAMKSEGTSNRSDDRIASYSSKGPTNIDQVVKPDIVAPGNKIASTVLEGQTITNLYPANAVLDSYYIAGGPPLPSMFYFQLSGTSMAAPMVSGAAALLLQVNPNWTPDQVKARLMHTAYKTFPISSVAIDPSTGKAYTSYYDLFTVGSGYLDIAAAISDHTPFTGRSLSPSVKWDPVSKKAILNCANAICSTGGLFGADSLWGDSLIIKPTMAVWGSDSLWGDGTLWGTDSLWGQSTSLVLEPANVVVGEK